MFENQFTAPEYDMPNQDKHDPEFPRSIRSPLKRKPKEKRCLGVLVEILTECSQHSLSHPTWLSDDANIPEAREENGWQGCWLYRKSVVWRHWKQYAEREQDISSIVDKTKRWAKAVCLTRDGITSTNCNFKVTTSSYWDGEGG